MRAKLAVFLVTLTLTPSGALGQEWVSCAQEGETCRFAGVKVVRYGASDRFHFGTFTDGVTCSNAAFGDPIGGVRKRCWVYETPREAGEGPDVLRLQRELQARDERIQELQAEVEARGQRVNEFERYVEERESQGEENQRLREEVELRGERIEELQDYIGRLEGQLERQRRFRRGQR